MSKLRILAAAAVIAAIATPSASALDIVAEPDVLADGVVGQPYSHQFIGEEGCPPSYNFALDSGYLPPGLVLNAKGKLDGIPTTPGDYHFFVELTDGSGPGACNSTPSQADFHIRILPALVITTPALAPTRAGAPFQAKLETSGANPVEVTWSLSGGSLPAGVALARNGTLAGTPTATGSHTFTVRAQDPGPKRVVTKDFTLVVAAPLSITGVSAGPAEVGIAFRASAAVTGGAAPFTWTIADGTLPAGLRLDAASGSVSGTPAGAGSAAVTLAVVDAAGQRATTRMSIAVAPRLAIASSRLTARVGRPYSQRMAKRGGVGAVTWRIAGGSLPAGLRLNTRTGVVSGTPAVAGTTRVTLTARDALGAVARRTVVFSVA